MSERNLPDDLRLCQCEPEYWQFLPPDPICLEFKDNDFGICMNCGHAKECHDPLQ